MLSPDTALALDVAQRAADVLLDLRARAAQDGWAPQRTKDEGDRASHLAIIDALRDARPADAVLSEEGADDPARLRAERVWIVDPLDGTREFSEPGRKDWAVHVALAVGGVVRTGVVALPALGELLTGEERRPVAATERRRPRILVSRSRPPAEAEAIAAALDGELVPMGSAGAKTAAVVRGDADLYVHSGGQYEWDLAAPVAVALAAGLHATRIDGSPFRFNREDPYLPDALIGRPALAAAALEALRGRRHV